MRSCFAAIPLLLAIAVAAQAAEPQKSVINPPPTTQDWADLAKLPDWSGVWNPKITDQGAQIRTNMPPWTPKVAAQIALAQEAAYCPVEALMLDHCGHAPHLDRAEATLEAIAAFVARVMEHEGLACLSLP